MPTHGKADIAKFPTPKKGYDQSTFTAKSGVPSVSCNYDLGAGEGWLGVRKRNTSKPTLPDCVTSGKALFAASVSLSAQGPSSVSSLWD